jgi:hypothetical protein
MTMRIGSGTHSREICFRKSDDDTFVEVFEVPLVGQATRIYRNRHTKDRDVWPYDEATHITEKLNQALDLDEAGASLLANAGRILELRTLVQNCLEKAKHLVSNLPCLPQMRETFSAELLQENMETAANVALFNYSMKGIRLCCASLNPHLQDAEQKRYCVSTEDTYRELEKLTILAEQLLDMVRASKAYTAFCMPPFGSETDLIEARDVSRELCDMLMRVIEALTLPSSPFGAQGGGSLGVATHPR